LKTIKDLPKHSRPREKLREKGASALTDMETMKPFQNFPSSLKKSIRYVLTDIDDTLTLHGLLPAAALAAMEKLRDAGVAVIPITGRPAGWCDHIARMWPVAAVVGENGAFYYRYDRELRKMERCYFKTAEQREVDRGRLEELKAKILAEVPGCAVSADQAYREADLAIDFCEDVPRLSPQAVERIVQIFEAAGAQAKVSSIHVNGWFGAYDKLTMTRRLFRDAFKEDLEAIKSHVIFAGDSPNDQPMFAFFPNAVGVANVREFAARMESLPGWVTQLEGGGGFAEMVDVLLS
jgi:HAD superfamily hydrolase (TIGR01484 family)